MHEIPDSTAAMQEKLRDFFANYEMRINRALADPSNVDIEAEAHVFTDIFIEANPAGIMSFNNDEQFREAVPQNYAFQRSIGTQSMRIAELAIIPIDIYHAMVKVHWETHYRRQDANDIHVDFDETYLVQIADETPKIFAYISGDQDKLLKQHGLIKE